MTPCGGHLCPYADDRYDLGPTRGRVDWRSTRHSARASPVRTPHASVVTPLRRRARGAPRASAGVAYLASSPRSSRSRHAARTIGAPLRASNPPAPAARHGRMTVTHAEAVPSAEARSKRAPRKVPHSSTVPEFTRHTTVATTSASLAEYLETAVTRSSNVLWSAMPSSLLDDVLRGPPVSVHGRVMRQGPTRGRVGWKADAWLSGTSTPHDPPPRMPHDQLRTVGTLRPFTRRRVANQPRDVRPAARGNRPPRLRGLGRRLGEGHRPRDVLEVDTRGVQGAMPEELERT